MRAGKRLRHLWRRWKFQRELAEEVRLHREMSESRWRENGASAQEARDRARREFGNETAALEQSLGVWQFGWLEELLQDVRFAVRGWARSPGFAVTVIATIGLALGLNTTLFTAFDHYVLRPLAVRDPGSLYEATWVVKSGDAHAFNWEEFKGLREQKDILSGAYAAVGVLGQMDQRQVWGQLVTPDYFEMLGARVTMGRPFTPEDAPVPGVGAYIVLGYSCWQGKYGSNPAIIGKKVYLRGQPFEVIGVAAPDFIGVGPITPDFWVPMTMFAALNSGAPISGPSKSSSLTATVRIRPSVSLETAKAALLLWSRMQSRDYPIEDRATGIYLESRASAVPLSREVLLSFAPIFIALGLVLVTACANVSNMMLARALMRQQEIGIRLSLGAGRPRLVRQLLTEAFLLALPAALAGFAISELTLRVLREIFYRTLPATFAKLLKFPEMHPDARVFAFILFGAFVTTLLFGLVPAVQATRSSVAYATRGDFGNDFRPSRLRNALVVAQVLVCTLLLITSLIILRSEARLAKRDLRMHATGVLDVRVPPALAAKFADKFRQQPLVETVAAVSRAPLYGGLPAIGLVLPHDRNLVRSYFNMVSPEYFDLLRIRILSGRNFTPDEAKAQAAVAIVSEATARRLWPNGSALGQDLQLEPGRPNRLFTSPAFTGARVVGVAQDVNNGLFTEAVDPACVYFPLAPGSEAVKSLLVRAYTDAEAARTVLDSVIEQTAPGAADQINPLEEVVAAQLYPFQALSWLSGLLAAVAVVFVISGIYGVLSYVVNQRRKEIGVRMALGASRSDVVGMILGQSMRLALMGTALGTGAALAVAPLVAHEIDTLRPFELSPYGISMAVILTAVAAASLIPSKRASRLDAASLLRSD